MEVGSQSRRFFRDVLLSNFTCSGEQTLGNGHLRLVRPLGFHLEGMESRLGFSDGRNDLVSSDSRHFNHRLGVAEESLIRLYHFAMGSYRIGQRDDLIAVLDATVLNLR